MVETESARHLHTKPMIVGTVHSVGSLRAAERLRRGEIDLVELRVDAFAAAPEALLQAASRIKVPRLVTVRHPAEGGVGGLGFARRRELYRLFFPVAKFIDVEARSAGKFADLLAEAREMGIRIVISAHDFRRTPSTAQLQHWVAAAAAAGAHVCKIAAATSNAADLGRLLALFSRPTPLPISAMGMGPLGKVSRLVLARAGSLLNYGFLDRPNASGQWEVHELKARLAEVA